jgi:hypothetical protein
MSEEARLTWRTVFLLLWVVGIAEAATLDAGWMALMLFVIAFVDVFNQPMY